jgi:hypothetical protein
MVSSPPGRGQILLSIAVWIADNSNAPAAERRGKIRSRRHHDSRKQGSSSECAIQGTKEHDSGDYLPMIRFPLSRTYDTVP